MKAAMLQATADVAGARRGTAQGLRGLIGFNTAAMMNVDDGLLSGSKLIQSSIDQVIKWQGKGS